MRHGHISLLTVHVSLVFSSANKQFVQVFFRCTYVNFLTLQVNDSNRAINMLEAVSSCAATRSAGVEGSMTGVRHDRKTL